MKSFIKEYWKWIFPLLLFAVLGFFFRIGMEHDPHEIESPLVDQPVPAFALPSLLNSKQILTEKMFQGKVTLLNVFASWCISCRAEHPVLMDIAAENKKIVIVGMDYRDAKTDALALIKQLGNPYQQIIFDGQGNLGINLGVYGTPESFLIDQKGVIRYKQIGPISPDIWKDELLPKINILLKERS